MEVQLFSEDSSISSFTVIEFIVKQALLYQGHSQISIKDNVDEDEEGKSLSFQKVLKSNYWYSESKTLMRQERVAFKKALTTALFENKPLIIWHFDGDKKFSDFESSSCIAHVKFEEILSKIKDEVSDRHGNSRKLHKNNIVLMIPCYSIEAWLFQNKSFYDELIESFEKLLKFAPESNHSSIREIIEKLNFLKSLPVEEFDEIEKIKEFFPRDKANKYYPLMAENLPYDELVKIDKSYADFIKNLEKALA